MRVSGDCGHQSINEKEGMKTDAEMGAHQSQVEK
jgi:hypothetical protein